MGGFFCGLGWDEVLLVSTELDSTRLQEKHELKKEMTGFGFFEISANNIKLFVRSKGRWRFVARELLSLIRR